MAGRAAAVYPKLLPALAVHILLIGPHFNNVRSTRLIRYAAELTRRNEYKPAGLFHIAPIQTPSYVGPCPRF